MCPDGIYRTAGAQELKYQISRPKDMFDEFPHCNFQFAFQSISNLTCGGKLMHPVGLSEDEQQIKEESARNQDGIVSYGTMN